MDAITSSSIPQAPQPTGNQSRSILRISGTHFDHFALFIGHEELTEPQRPSERSAKPSAMALKFKAAHESELGSPPKRAWKFNPQLIFFYGSRTVPCILQRVLSLCEPPTYYRASIDSFKVKMYGVYPALVKATDEGIVQGLVYTVKSEDDMQKLIAYEGDAYRLTWCFARMLDPTPAVQVHVYMIRNFEYCGPPELLRDGEFNPSALPPLPTSTFAGILATAVV